MIYVDNARIPAKVGKIRGRWSHLTADTQEELHEFAEQIGLKRGWYQEHCKVCRNTCPHWHYDVTESMRSAAVSAGAKSIDIRDLGRIISKRREGQR